MAQLDAGGALHVGPASAGADPGPACYGKGRVATVTDANLVLSRIQPDYFLKGAKGLSIKRAEEAIQRLAGPVQLSVKKMAREIIYLVNSNMEQAIRVVSVERGYDPRECTLISFGGAGGLHACALAEALRIPRVFVPRHPGVLSAWGAVFSDVVRDYVQTVAFKSSRSSLHSAYHILIKTRATSAEKRRVFRIQ